MTNQHVKIIHRKTLTGRDLDRDGQVRLLMELDYSIHFHVWRPETFLELLAAARHDEGLQHEIVAFEPCIAGSDDEYIFVLRVGEFDSPPSPPVASQTVAAIPGAGMSVERADATVGVRSPGQTYVRLSSPDRPRGNPAISTSLKRRRMADWLHGDGIELGALHSPLPVPESARVRYVDRLAVEGLRSQYPELADLDLVPVSYTGSAEDLSALQDNSLDFVIACHVMEHLEDPTRGVREIHRVLRVGGIFYCALPEPRVTFDQHRDVTAVEHLLDDHPAGRTTKREHFTDWVMNVERHQPWWEKDPPDIGPRIDRLVEMDYSIHYHVWRPDTFLDYISALRRRDAIDFELIAFEGCDPSGDNEFIMLLRKGVGVLPASPPVPATASSGPDPKTPHADMPPPQTAHPARTDMLREIAGRSARLGRRGAQELRTGGPRRLAITTARWARRHLRGSGG